MDARIALILLLILGLAALFVGGVIVFLLSLHALLKRPNPSSERDVTDGNPDDGAIP